MIDTKRLRQLLADAQERFRRLREKTITEEGEVRQIDKLPSWEEAWDRAEALPAACRSLFDRAPLADPSLLVGREAEMAALTGAALQWRQGRAGRIAVIGPEGSGKSSLINAFLTGLPPEVPVMRGEVAHPLEDAADLRGSLQGWLQAPGSFSSADDVIAHLKERGPAVLVLEGGHNLGLRVPGGAAPAEELCTIMLGSSPDILWVLACRQHPWAMLEYRIRFGRFFTDQVRTLFQGEEAIRKALLERLAATGLPLRFAAGGDASADAPQEDQKTLEERFFSELFTASGGSMTAALYFWLISVSCDPQQQGLLAVPPGRIDHGLLRSLERDQLFTLAEVTRQGGLSVADHARIFLCAPRHSRLTLELLAQSNLLVTTPSGGAGQTPPFSLNPIFFGPVSATLESMNILY